MSDEIKDQSPEGVVGRGVGVGEPRGGVGRPPRADWGGQWRLRFAGLASSRPCEEAEHR